MPMACRRVAITQFFSRIRTDRSAARQSGAGRIHAAVFDACLYVVPGHSGRDFHLRLHPQPGGQLLLWSRLWPEEHRRGLDHAPAPDHRHLAGFGQTLQIQRPRPHLHGAAASVSSNQYTYGTTNNKLVDISPTGNICAGTWNRNTGGGIADYTYCNFPNPLPSTSGLPYSVAYITASADSVTSNPVKVFVHAQVSSVSLVGPQQCLSQTQVANLDAQACYSSNGQQYLLCAPSSVTNLIPQPRLPAARRARPGSIPSCTVADRLFELPPAPPSWHHHTNTNQITANQPGTTAINASIAGSGSSAGYFSTCPPQSIKVTLASGATTGTITQGVRRI
jgi:hypothetical protein